MQNLGQWPFSTMDDKGQPFSLSSQWCNGSIQWSYATEIYLMVRMRKSCVQRVLHVVHSRVPHVLVDI